MRIPVISESEVSNPSLILLPNKLKEANLHKNLAQKEFLQLIELIVKFEEEFFESLFVTEGGYKECFQVYANKFLDLIIRTRNRGTKFWKINPSYFDNEYAPHPDVPERYYSMR